MRTIDTDVAVIDTDVAVMGAGTAGFGGLPRHGLPATSRRRGRRASRR